MQILYMDTEGFEASGKSDAYDDRIFALSTVVAGNSAGERRGEAVVRRGAGGRLLLRQPGMRLHHSGKLTHLQLLGQVESA
jgi:hypothetical protein